LAFIIELYSPKRKLKSVLKQQFLGQYKVYDPRFRTIVIEFSDLKKFIKYGVPVSTMRSWKAKGLNPNFFTLDIFDKDNKNLCKRIIDLEHALSLKNIEITLLKESRSIFDFLSPHHGKSVTSALGV
jgi:hypothetical protein